jgi:hypothetical protein
VSNGGHPCGEGVFAAPVHGLGLFHFLFLALWGPIREPFAEDERLQRACSGGDRDMFQEGPRWPPSPRAATVKSGGLLRHVWWLGQAPHRRGVTEDGRQRAENRHDGSEAARLRILRARSWPRGRTAEQQIRVAKPGVVSSSRPDSLRRVAIRSTRSSSRPARKRFARPASSVSTSARSLSTGALRSNCGGSSKKPRLEAARRRWSVSEPSSKRSRRSSRQRPASVGGVGLRARPRNAPARRDGQLRAVVDDSSQWTGSGSAANERGGAAALATILLSSDSGWRAR